MNTQRPGKWDNAPSATVGRSILNSQAAVPRRAGPALLRRALFSGTSSRRLGQDVRCMTFWARTRGRRSHGARPLPVRSWCSTLALIPFSTALAKFSL